MRVIYLSRGGERRRRRSTVESKKTRPFGKRCVGHFDGIMAVDTGQYMFQLNFHTFLLKQQRTDNRTNIKIKLLINEKAKTSGRITE